MKMKFGIRNRMLVLIGVVVIFIGIVVAFFVYEAGQSKDMMIARVGDLMLADAKDKIQVATNNMAVSISGMLAKSGGKDPIEGIRGLIADVRFESDKSGYFLCSRIQFISSCRQIPPVRDRMPRAPRTSRACITCVN